MGGLGNELFFLLLYLNFKKQGYKPSLLVISKLNLNKIIDLTNDSILYSTSYKIYQSVKKKNNYLAHQILRTRSLYYKYYLGLVKFVSEIKLFAAMKLNSPLLSGFYFDTSLLRYSNRLDLLSLSLEKNYTFTGYWQHYSIVKDDLIQSIREQLHPFEINQALGIYDSLKETNKTIIAVHVRGGDFERLESASFLNKKYYELAIKKSEELLGENLKFYLFTDDLVKLETIIPAFFSKNYQIISSVDFHKDFFLLMNFSNFILSNSTFSFWASLLSDKHNKIIIRPTPMNLDLVDELILGNEILINKDLFQEK